MTSQPKSSDHQAVAALTSCRASQPEPKSPSRKAWRLKTQPAFLKRPDTPKPMTKATNPNTPKRKSPAACDSLPSNHNVKEPRKRSDKHPSAMKGQVVSCRCFGDRGARPRSLESMPRAGGRSISPSRRPERIYRDAPRMVKRRAKFFAAPNACSGSNGSQLARLRDISYRQRIAEIAGDTGDRRHSDSRAVQRL